MADIVAINNAVRAKKAELDEQYPKGYLFVTSLNNLSTGSTGGTVTEAPNLVAARLIVAGSAKVSTKDEIEAHKARASENATRAKKMDDARDKKVDPTEQAAILASAMRQAMEKPKTEK